MVLEFANLTSRNVFRARKQENKPKQLWKKRKIDGAGAYWWIVNSQVDNLFLTAMGGDQVGGDTLKLKGIPQSQSHFKKEIKLHIF